MITQYYAGVLTSNLHPNNRKVGFFILCCGTALCVRESDQTNHDVIDFGWNRVSQIGANSYGRYLGKLRFFKKAESFVLRRIHWVDWDDSRTILLVQLFVGV